MDYFINDLVENVYDKENMIGATVYGTKEYKVEIVKDNGKVINLSCNCPYADDGNNCKHMAAVLFYLEDKEELLAREDLNESIDKLLEEADPILLKDFLFDILKNDERLLNRLKNKLECDISPTDMESYKNQVNNIFRRYAGYHDFLDYKNAWNFISELEEFPNNDIQAMIDNNQLKEHLDLLIIYLLK